MPVGAGYGLVGWAASGDEPIITPSFSQPVSMTYDGSHLWVSDNGSALLQKVNVTNPMPGVVAAVNLSGLGVTKVREIRYDPGSGYLFASCHDSDLVLIIDKATHAVVGRMNLAARSRSVTFDGTGHVWALQRDPGGTATLHKYNIAAVVAAYPSAGTPVQSFPYAHFMEQLHFGGGFIWAGTGENEFYFTGTSPFTGGDAYDQTISGGLLMRIDPTNGAFVAHVSGGPGQPPGLINGHSVWTAFYAFGSVWTGDDIVSVGRWDPAQFEPRDPSNPTWHWASTVLRSGSFAGEPVTDATSVWIGCGITQPNVHRVNATTNVVTEIQTVQGFESMNGSAFDGTNVWFTRRFANTSTRGNGIFRMNMTPGSEHVDWQIINGADQVSAVVPSRGAAGGGVAVIIKGYGFSNATGVTFNGSTAGSFAVVDANTITCTTPSGSAGLANVVVLRPTTNLTYNGGYRYA